MLDREKVIKGLRCCRDIHKGARLEDSCNICPYQTEKGRTCYADELFYDALALLKAQEAVEPIMHYVPDGKRSSAAWQCGNCLIDIGYGANYCYNCGRKVKWE